MTGYALADTRAFAFAGESDAVPLNLAGLEGRLRPLC